MSALFLLLATALAQPFAPPATPPLSPPLAPGQGAPTPGEHTEMIEVVAIKARQTGVPEIDPSLREAEPLLRNLLFDTFELVFREEKPVELGAFGLFPLNDSYLLQVVLGPQLSQQEVGLEVAVLLVTGQQPVNALRASGQVPRGRALVFRGLELPEGELVVLVSVKPPENQDQQDQQQQSAAAQQQEQQQQQQEEQDENQQSEDEESQEEQEQPMAQSQPQDQDEEQDAQEQEREQPSPEELQNIEALLESLREQDRREQQDAQNRRQRVIVTGDWW